LLTFSKSFSLNLSTASKILCLLNYCPLPAEVPGLDPPIKGCCCCCGLLATCLLWVEIMLFGPWLFLTDIASKFSLNLGTYDSIYALACWSWDWF
jgi:hypothetical protein